MRDGTSISIRRESIVLTSDPYSQDDAEDREAVLPRTLLRIALSPCEHSCVYLERRYALVSLVARHCATRIRDVRPNHLCAHSAAGSSLASFPANVSLCT